MPTRRAVAAPDRPTSFELIDADEVGEGELEPPRRHPDVVDAFLRLVVASIHLLGAAFVALALLGALNIVAALTGGHAYCTIGR